MKRVQIKVECNQQLERAAAFGVRELGTALVVRWAFTNCRDKGRSGSAAPNRSEQQGDYQSGTKLPHSKGCADLIYAQASDKMHPIRSGFTQLVALPLALLFNLSATQAQTTQFTYQGRLTEGGNPANGVYEGRRSNSRPPRVASTAQVLG